MSDDIPNVDMSFIAGKAGVSRSTVARVISKPHLVKERTRALVQSVLAEYKYVYSHHAAEFSTKKSSMFGLIIPTVQSSIYTEFIEGIHDGVKGTPYDLAIGYTDYDTDEEREYIRGFSERRMAGIIVLGVKEQTQDLIYDITARGIMSVVSTWEYSPEHPVSCVGFDNYEAARRMTRHLLSLGHRRIGLIVGPMAAAGRVFRRTDGYRNAISEAGITVEDRYIIHTRPSLAEGREAAMRLMALDTPPTAIFAASDALAIGVLKAMRDLRRKVPEDVSVAGFDNIDIASYCSPALTTIKVPAYEMGEKAVAQLICQAEDPGCGVRKYCLDTELIVRDSCGPPPTPTPPPAPIPGAAS